MRWSAAWSARRKHWNHPREVRVEVARQELGARSPRGHDPNGAGHFRNDRPAATAGLDAGAAQVLEDHAAGGADAHADVLVQGLAVGGRLGPRVVVLELHGRRLVVVDDRHHRQLAGDLGVAEGGLGVHEDQAGEGSVVELLAVGEVQVQLAHHGQVLGPMDLAHGGDGRLEAEGLLDEELHADRGAHGVRIRRAVGQDQEAALVRGRGGRLEGAAQGHEALLGAEGRVAQVRWLGGVHVRIVTNRRVRAHPTAPGIRSPGRSGPGRWSGSRRGRGSRPLRAPAEHPSARTRPPA